MSPLALLGLAASLWAAVAAATPAVPPPAGPRPASAGRYLLRGAARTDVSVLPAREYPLDVLALVAPGEAPGTVRLHLRSRGHACELRAVLGERDVLTIPAGQTCVVELDEAEGRGRVEARLRSASGRLAHRELSLQSTWEVSGSASLSSGGRVLVPGTTIEVEVPAAPSVPVRGTVDAAVSGLREELSGPGARTR